ncbi:nitroreductase family protein (plasmid) [Streptomyces mirabilis]|uniref:Acg family FMN-binding oxidoreductase n=1 Tax=Streptomyces mirabilis TaxID=68239 RepID=UPI001BAF4A75|nr:nitroreductase family protein [Streptomyces mirabilis]QUW85536.1 nitroreductase family protein [Streptomyces mirabilis]
MLSQRLDAKAVTALVKDATAAPSMHNAQPWRFRFFHGSSTFHLRADPGRAMPHADPAGRALHLGCGAALFNLRVAAAHAGWEPATELLPDPADPQLLATVRLTDPARISGALAALYPAIPRRHTSRHPFAETDIPPAVQDTLRDAARQEGARLAFPGAWHVQSLLELVHDAEGRDAVDAERAEELARWTRIGADTATDGIPEYAFGPRKRDGKAPVRDFAGRSPVADRGTATFEHTPHLVLLGTSDDGPDDWLHAGQAMERVLLLATVNGLSTSLTSHALEWPDLRWIVRDPQTAMGHVQMVLRLGYGPEAPKTPRRPVEDVLDVE